MLFIVIVFHAIGKFCKWDNGAGVAWKALIRNFWNSLLMLLAISACTFCFAGTLKSAMRKHCWSFRRLPIRRVQLGSALASTLSGKGLCTNTRQSALKVENSKQASLPLLRARAKRQARLMHVNIPESNGWEKERQKDLTFPCPYYNYKSCEGVQVLQIAAMLPLPSRSCWFSTSDQDIPAPLWLPVLPLKGFKPRSGSLLKSLHSHGVCPTKPRLPGSIRV